MMDELAYLEDSILSLLPRTIGLRSETKPAVSETQELEAIKFLFKSMVSNSSKEHLEQAKYLLKNILDPLQFCPEDGDITVDENGEDHPQGRRPALGRKRAQLLVKPSTSPSWGNLELKSSLPVDPEEFFSWQEKIENADRELNKLRGQGVVSTAATQHYQSTTGRQRRPGILRKAASYKHSFPVCTDNKEAFIISQDEVLERGASNLSTIATDTEFTIFLHPNNRPDKLQEMETNGSQLSGVGQSEVSVAEKTKAESIILDSLLSSFKDLGEDEGDAFLQAARLQFKPTNVDKIRLPELNRVQKVGVRGTIVKEMGEKVNGSLFSQTSPTLTRSPLAATSLLQRRFSQRDPQQDPYAFPPDDASPANNFSSVEGHGKCAFLPPVNIHHLVTRSLGSEDASTPVKKKGRSSYFKEKMHSSTSAGQNISGSKIVLDGLLTEDSPCSLDSRTDHYPRKFGCASGFRSSGLDGCAKEKGGDAAVHELQGPGIGGLTSGTPEPNQTEDLVGCGSNKGEEKSRLDNVVDVGSFGIGCVLEDEVNNTQQDEPTSQDSEGFKGTNLSVDTCSDNLNKLAEQHNEEVQRASRLSVIRRVEPKAPPRNSTRRKSLAEAGTTREAGLRRSTRIRTRPLEYWRGERFLYGRIHESLATVIGIKYSSPFKDGGKPTLKVKSYVSEEYAELVKKSALH